VEELKLKKDEIVMTLEGIGLQYGSQKQAVEALSDINLKIKKGEFICVLGPSGCGKSTLLGVMAGLLKPTCGCAKMLGSEITGVDWHRAVVFQTPTLYPWLNTYNNVAFGPKMRKRPKEEIKRLTTEYLDLVGLSEFAKSKPYELSGGMKQRAALARVLVNQPYMVLMDEPFGALDALTRSNMQDLIRRIWIKTENTVFLITHDVDEALSLATRVLVMSHRPGTIVREVATDFTFQLEGSCEDARYSPEYIRTRKEILDIINTQNPDVSSGN